MDPFNPPLTPTAQPRPFEGMCCAKLRNIIWKLFEDPNSSNAAKVKQVTMVVARAITLTTRLMEIAPGPGDSQLPIPPRLHRDAHPLHRAGVPGDRGMLLMEVLTNVSSLVLVEQSFILVLYIQTQIIKVSLFRLLEPEYSFSLYPIGINFLICLYINILLSEYT